MPGDGAQAASFGSLAVLPPYSFRDLFVQGPIRSELGAEC
jgi:hypothetical protein